jgi:hypothetical protein
MFSIFVRQHKPSSVVAFSDNRLSGGKIYEKLGFVPDKEVPQGYRFVRGSRRYSKDELPSVKKSKKVWDLGKTRWVLRIN